MAPQKVNTDIDYTVRNKVGNKLEQLAEQAVLVKLAELVALVE